MSHWKTIGYRINYYGTIAGVFTAIRFEFRVRDSDTTLGALLTELARCPEAGATIDASREWVGGDSKAFSVVPIAYIGSTDAIRALGRNMEDIGFDIRNPLEAMRDESVYCLSNEDEATRFLEKQGLAPYSVGTDVYWIDDAGNLATVETTDVGGKFVDVTFHARSASDGVRPCAEGSRGIGR